MDQASASPHKPRWWHSRRNRQRALLPVYLGLMGTLAWLVFSGGLDSGLYVWLAALALNSAEWLWFRVLDPNYPYDDSLARSERSFLPPEGQRWWQSRYRRQGVVFWVMAMGSTTLAMLFDRPEIWAFGLVAYYLVDWLWFRFFDPAYPEDDLEIDPASEVATDDGFSEALFWIAVLATALVIFIVLTTLLAR